MDNPTLKTRALMWAPLVALVALIGPALQAGSRNATADGPHMLGIAMRLGWMLREGAVGEALRSAMTLIAPHPPGAYLPATALYAALGPSAAVAHAAGLLWLLLLWDGAVRLMRAQGWDGSRAWVLALGAAATPLYWGQLDSYGVDLGSAAVTAQALGWLVASDGLRDRRAAALAGAWIGAGFWVKYTFPVFLYLPCLLVALHAVVDLARGADGARGRIVSGLALTASTAALLGPLALISGQNILGYVLHSATPEDSEIVGNLGSAFGPSASPFDIQFFYAAVLKDLWGWPGLALLATGLALAAREAPRRWAALLSLSAALGALPVLTHLDIKADRYLTPLLAPLLCVALPPLAARWRALLPIATLAAPVLFLWRDFSGWTHGLPIAEVDAFSAVAAEQRRAPTNRDFDHRASEQLARWGAWPKVEEPFRPITTELAAWKLDEILLAMHERYGQREGQVGLCLTEQSGTPGFGMFLMAAERLDLHWDFVTTMVLPGQGAGGQLRTFQFVGPFKQGDDEQVWVDVLFVSHRRGGQSPQRAYLESLQTTDTQSFALPGGLEGQVVRVSRPGSP